MWPYSKIHTTPREQDCYLEISSQDVGIIPRICCLSYTLGLSFLQTELQARQKLFRWSGRLITGIYQHLILIYASVTSYTYLCSKGACKCFILQNRPTTYFHQITLYEKSHPCTNYWVDIPAGNLVEFVRNYLAGSNSHAHKFHMHGHLTYFMLLMK